MKYLEAEFTFSGPNADLNDARDLVAALAGEAGFESFEETPTGLKGYVQQQLFSSEALNEALNDFPIPTTNVSYTICEADYRDWNAEWEQQGFDPIVIGPIIIHDGRHLPPSTHHLSPSTLMIEIDAQMAFGTGTHETTRMICQMLLELRPTYPVLDCGCGTGILSICALKLGASKATGYDIDEWSTDNARHNAIINRVDEHFDAFLGNSSLLGTVIQGKYPLVMANINRNILLEDMPRFVSMMANDKESGSPTPSHLILSGFYTDDIPLLMKRAQELGLSLVGQKEEAGWAAILLKLKSEE